LKDRSESSVSRDYWARIMDEAYAFMQRIRSHPIDECGERVVDLPQLATHAGVDMRFSKRPHVDALPRMFYLRAGISDLLIGAASEMNDQGWSIVVEDGFRSVAMQRGLTRAPYILDTVARLVVWEAPAPEKQIEVLRRRAAALVANWPRTATHMSASAVDISVVDSETNEYVDRGGPYLELSQLTPMHSPFVSGRAAENRLRITEIMGKYGFVAYPYEFWHYSQGDTFAEYLQHSGTPSRYGPVSINLDTLEVMPLADIETELNPISEIEVLATDALERATREAAEQRPPVRRRIVGTMANGLAIPDEDVEAFRRLSRIYGRGLGALHALVDEETPKPDQADHPVASEVQSR
jgi:zinc D-Ala-D-Ala dipeptidase